MSLHIETPFIFHVHDLDEFLLTEKQEQVDIDKLTKIKKINKRFTFQL